MDFYLQQSSKQAVMLPRCARVQGAQVSFSPPTTPPAPWHGGGRALEGVLPGDEAAAAGDYDISFALPQPDGDSDSDGFAALHDVFQRMNTTGGTELTIEISRTAQKQLVGGIESLSIIRFVLRMKKINGR